jgi:transposase-like protein
MHATPFHCPYCGESDIVPTEDEATWFCKTCQRQWKLVFLRLGKPREE